LKKKNHYLNNEDFLKAIIEYKDQIWKAKENNLKRPPIPEYIGECFLLIAKRLSTNPKYYGYTYREDMIGDALIDCVKYIDRFDPEKSKNPFAYFTQFMYHAFIRCIGKEKQFQETKFRYLENLELVGNVSEKQVTDTKEYDNTYTKFFYEKRRESSYEFRQKRDKKKVKKQTIGVSQFEV